MRYFISFIILAFCSTPLFSQNDNDTTTVTLTGVTVTWKQVWLRNGGTICSFERKPQ